jgi:hypothetical protein
MIEGDCAILPGILISLLPNREQHSWCFFFVLVWISR